MRISVKKGNIWLSKDYVAINLNLTQNIRIQPAGNKWRLCFVADRDGGYFEYYTEEGAQEAFEKVMAIQL